MIFDISIINTAIANPSGMIMNTILKVFIMPKAYNLNDIVVV